MGPSETMTNYTALESNRQKDKGNYYYPGDLIEWIGNIRSNGRREDILAIILSTENYVNKYGNQEVKYQVLLP